MGSPLHFLTLSKYTQSLPAFSLAGICFFLPCSYPPEDRMIVEAKLPHDRIVDIRQILS